MRSDLIYEYGGTPPKQSDPVEILRAHALHLFHGGDGDVTIIDSDMLSRYKITIFSLDTSGNKMLLTNRKRTDTMHGSNNVDRAIADKRKEGTLWLEAKVEPKPLDEVKVLLNQMCQTTEQSFLGPENTLADY